MDPKALERHKKRKTTMFNQLESDGWMSRYREVSKFLLPRMGRFLTNNANKLDNSAWSSILDAHGSRAHRIMSSGLMSSKSSKARPWFRLTIEDKSLAENAAVKSWLFELTSNFNYVYSKSNTYRALQTVYDELTGFGTAPCLVDSSYENLIHLSPLTVGEYAMSVDNMGHINTLYRSFEWRVHQVIEEFGLENVSQRTKDHYDRGDLDVMVKINHGICPRYKRDTQKKDNKNMPFESVYWEEGEDGAVHKPLRESGHRRFPGFAPRWDVLGKDTLGVSQAMAALGSIKELQHNKKTKNSAIAFMANPTMVLPHTMKSQQNRIVPGGFIYSDMMQDSAIKSAFDVRLDLNHLNADTQDVRNSIDQAFFVDLFMMASQIDKSGMTAYEMAKKHEEKLIMLGPADMRLDFELYDPLIDITLDAILTATVPGGYSFMPPPPPEISGKELKVEYVSILSQAQKLAGMESIERVIGVVGSLAQIGKTGALDKINEDQIVDIASDLFGADPSAIVADKNVAIIRQQRAQQQQQQAMQENGAASIRDLGAGMKSITEAANQETSLSDLLASIPGYAAVGGQ